MANVRGRPKGSGKDYKDKPADKLLDLLNRELLRRDDGYEKASLVVKTLVNKAISKKVGDGWEAGDVRAAMAIFDRICGKVKESKIEAQVSVVDFFPDSRGSRDIKEFETDNVSVREVESELPLRLYESDGEAERVREDAGLGHGEGIDTQDGAS